MLAEIVGGMDDGKEVPVEGRTLVIRRHSSRPNANTVAFAEDAVISNELSPWIDEEEYELQVNTRTGCAKHVYLFVSRRRV
jgi:hypothetical protein